MASRYLGEDIVGIFVVIQQDSDLGVLPGAPVPEFAKLPLHGLHLGVWTRDRRSDGWF